MWNMKYSEWKDTAHLLHMTLQMMGKVKLEKMASQPEWNQVLLNITPDGFTTGLIPDDSQCFDVSFDVVSGRIAAQCSGGYEAGFRIDGKLSINKLYESFQSMLKHIGHETKMNPKPQECSNLNFFSDQTDTLDYDCVNARNFLKCCTLAYTSILQFVAPFRCKKILPSMFWGTFDLSTVLFSGEEEPFSGSGIIGETAFDEKMVEFGFWPGDDKTEEPSFYALSYPFLASHPEGFSLRPQGAIFDREKKEYFLPLSEVLNASDPVLAIREFCSDALAAILHQVNWRHQEWFTKPLK